MTTVTDSENGWEAEDAHHYQAEADELLSQAVVRAVAKISDRDSAGTNPDDGADLFEPLYETIDPDALDALFRDADDEPRSGVIEFAYSGYEVTVRSAGLVTVTDRRP
jgi:hypothetical protein